MSAPTLVAATTQYPWWFILVFIFGAGGLGTIIYQGVSKGWKIFKGMTEILVVLRGVEGGQGRREVEPLVDVVDGLKTTVSGLVTDMTLVKLDLSAVKDEITCNGGTANTLGDRVVRTERGLNLLASTVQENHDELAERDETVKRELDTHIAQSEGLRTPS